MGLYEKALPAPWSWDQRLAGAAEAGYDFMEISIDESFERLARLDRSAAERAELSAQHRRIGVPILTMCLSGHRKYPLGSRSPRSARAGQDIMRRAIDFAVDVGVRIVQVAGYDVFYEESDDDTVARYLDGLHRAAEWAGQAGVMLALENVDVPLTESMAAAWRSCGRSTRPGSRFYPDMANVAAAGYDPVAELALCAGHLVAAREGWTAQDHSQGAVRRGHRAVRTGVPGAGRSWVLRARWWLRCGPTTDGGDPVATVRAARQFVADLVSENHHTIRRNHAAGRTATRRLEVQPGAAEIWPGGHDQRQHQRA